jgi:hypothetical protein
MRGLRASLSEKSREDGVISTSKIVGDLIALKSVTIFSGNFLFLHPK